MPSVDLCGWGKHFTTLKAIFLCAFYFVNFATLAASQKWWVGSITNNNSIIIVIIITGSKISSAGKNAKN